MSALTQIAEKASQFRLSTTALKEAFGRLKNRSVEIEFAQPSPLPREAWVVTHPSLTAPQPISSGKKRSRDNDSVSPEERPLKRPKLEDFTTPREQQLNNGAIEALKSGEQVPEITSIVYDIQPALISLVVDEKLPLNPCSLEKLQTTLERGVFQDNLGICAQELLQNLDTPGLTRTRLAAEILLTTEEDSLLKLSKSQLRVIYAMAARGHKQTPLSFNLWRGIQTIYPEIEAPFPYGPTPPDQIEHQKGELFSS